jgi:hypothetical protein
MIPERVVGVPGERGINLKADRLHAVFCYRRDPAICRPSESLESIDYIFFGLDINLLNPMPLHLVVAQYERLKHLSYLHRQACCSPYQN